MCSYLPEGDVAAFESVGLVVVGVTGFEKTFVTEIIPLGSVGEYLASDYVSVGLTPAHPSPMQVYLHTCNSRWLWRRSVRYTSTTFIP